MLGQCIAFTMIELIVIACVVSALGYLICGAIIFFTPSVRPLSRYTPAISFIAWMISCLLPSPGGWSDMRSQWVPSVAFLGVLIAVGVTSFNSALRGCLVRERLTGIFGLTLFVSAAPLAVGALYGSYLLFEEVRELHLPQ